MSGNASVPLVERLTGGRAAVVVGERTTSAGELGQRVHGLAAWLHGRGVRPGDRVLLLVPPGPELAAALLALVWVGAVPVLLEPGQAPGAWRARVASVEPAWAVVDPRLRVAWRVPGLLRILRARGRSLPPRPPGRLLSLPRRADGRVPVAPRTAADEGLILFTSGTTSAPRAVVHTHGNLPAFLAGVADVVRDLPLSSYLAETPQQIFYALLLGATCHIVRGQGEARLQRTLEVLRSGRVEAWFGSPWTWVRWLDAGYPVPPGLRTVLLGSSPVSRPFLRRLTAALSDDARVRCVYGLTEAGPVCVADAHEKIAWEGEGDLVGRPLDGVRLRLDDAGEVYVASPALAHGYLGREPLGEWLPTGDLGEFHPTAGLVLRGRRKDMILRRAVNLYPGVLEPLLLEVCDDAALVGVWDAEREDERVVLAWVGDAEPDAAALLGPDAAPDHLLHLDVLPRSGRQHKVDKAALRELARERFGVPA